MVRLFSSASSSTLYVFMMLTLAQLSGYLIFHNPVISASIFAAIPVLFAFLLAISVITSGRVGLGTTGFIILAFLALLPAISIVLQLILGVYVTDSAGRTTTDFLVFIYSLGLVWLLTGYAIGYRRFRINRTVALTSFLVFAAMVASNVEDGSLDYVSLRQGTGLPELSHLWIAEPGIILFFAAYAAFSSMAVRFGLVTAMTILLFSIGGRSSSILVVLSVISFEMLARKSTLGSLLLVTFTSLLALAALAFVMFFFFSDSPVFQFLMMGDWQADVSRLERSRAFVYGVDGIFNSFFGFAFGSTHEFVRSLGSVGFYIHNVLSGLQFFGFGFLVCALVALWYSFQRMMIALKFEKDESDIVFKSLLLIYCLFSLAFVKSFVTLSVWLSISVWLNHRYLMRN